MPVLTATEPTPATDTSLFIGLQSYSEAQAANFFGRDEEIHRLTNLVKANTLTIVFGKSGTGKTSLLNAGVFPRLRKDFCLPFRIRLSFDDRSPDLVTQIKEVLVSEIDKYGFKVEAYPSTETLWEYFHREQLWKSITPILIFDQFEEIFTLGAKSTRFGKKELDAFWEELSDLIENSIPEKLKSRFLNDKENIGFNYKVQRIKTLFSFREEFLPEFETVAVKIPSIKYSRFRLLPMNGNQAYEVITKTWKDNISDREARQIVEFFTNENEKDNAYELMTIEPSLLSQVCALIDRERIKEGGNKISAEFLNKYSKDIILRSIYNEALAESNKALNIPTAGNQRPMNEFIEDKLITDEGYRTKYVMSDGDEKLRPGIEVLKAKYFVRDEGKSVELTHDVLTPLIKHDREERRKELAMAGAKKKARKRAVIIVLVSILLAGVLWAFSAAKTSQALKEKEHAEKQKQVLDSQIKKASDTLTALKAALDTVKIKHKVLPSPIKNNTKAFDSLVTQLRNDSLQMASLNQHYAEVVGQKELLQKQLSTQPNQPIVPNNGQRRYDSLANVFSQQFAQLKRKMAGDSTRAAWTQDKLDALQKGYDILKKQFYDYQRTHPDVVNITDDPVERGPNNSVKVNLFDPKNGQAKVPNNLKIYLIPNNASNQNIITSAKNLKLNCNGLNLDGAAGGKTAKYQNGAYYFSDVSSGSYFIKICAVNGGYYYYTKSPNGKESVQMEVSQQ